MVSLQHVLTGLLPNPPPLPPFPGYVNAGIEIPMFDGVSFLNAGITLGDVSYLISRSISAGSLYFVNVITTPTFVNHTYFLLFSVNHTYFLLLLTTPTSACSAIMEAHVVQEKREEIIWNGLTNLFADLVH